jgi:hypothetical protein
VEEAKGQESSSHKQSTVTTTLGPWSPCPSGTPAAAALVLVVQSMVKQKGLDQVLLGSSNLFLWDFTNHTCMMSYNLCEHTREKRICGAFTGQKTLKTVQNITHQNVSIK